MREQKEISNESMPHYLQRIPHKLPKGEVLVHNQVVPRKVLGAWGFRAWTQKKDKTLVVCRCKWAGIDLHGLSHYRVNPKLLGKG